MTTPRSCIKISTYQVETIWTNAFPLCNKEERFPLITEIGPTILILTRWLHKVFIQAFPYSDIELETDDMFFYCKQVFFGRGKRAGLILSSQLRDQERLLEHDAHLM